jgi:hypothetical protein
MKIKTINFTRWNANLFDIDRLSDINSLLDPIGAWTYMPDFSVNTLLGIDTEFIDYDDAIENTTDILELSSHHFYALKERDWIRDKHILITNPAEPWILGIPFFDQLDYQPKVYDDPTLFKWVSNTKSFTIVSDNVDPRLAKKFPDINWVHANIWEQEAKTDRLIPEWLEDVNIKRFINDNTHNNKKHDFTCLLGKIKSHRLDMWFKACNSSLVENNIIGSWDKHIINPKYESNPSQRNDRDVKQQWVTQSKLWVSMETFPDVDSELYPITQITEKTFKPILYGMPFVINGSRYILDALRDMGYNPYTEIFGDYISKDWAETNDNIIHIIKNIDTYDWDRILQIALYNYKTLSEKKQDVYRQNLMEDIYKCI